MMRCRSRILMIIGSVVLAACVPNATTYYLPAVSGGIVSAARCVPTRSLMNFTIVNGDARLPVLAYADDGKHVHQIALFFSQEHWQSIHFATTDFRVRDLDKDRIIEPKSVIEYRDNGQGPLTTAPYTVANEKSRVRFSIQVNLAGGLPERFELISPAIVIDGAQTDFPVITFTRKVWAGISPFNC